MTLMISDSDARLSLYHHHIHTDYTLQCPYHQPFKLMARVKNTTFRQHYVEDERAQDMTPPESMLATARVRKNAQKLAYRERNRELCNRRARESQARYVAYHSKNSVQIYLMLPDAVQQSKQVH